MNAQASITQRLGEVIAASTTGFTAQSYELFDLPAFGSLVKTTEGGITVFAAVYHAQTEGIEPGRPAIARGRGEASEEAIYEHNPQLRNLLRSEFSALVLGFMDESGLHRYLPPRPAHIHAMVNSCTLDEVRHFGDRFDFLNAITQSRDEVPALELLPAVLRQMAAAQEDKTAFLTRAGRELARLLGTDYQTLRAVLERIKPG